jgi:glyoxylate utilization-related uncharacterized protein
MFSDISYIQNQQNPDIANIITLVRAHQKSGLAINYNEIIKEIELQGGSSHPELKNVKTLLYSLRDTNPYS